MTSQFTSTGDLSKDIDALLALDASPEELARQLFLLDLERKRATNPELAEMLRACAIPRRFDAGMIGVLRDAPHDQKANERLLSELIAYNFVLSRQDGGYVYHDNTRDMLLDDWRTDETLREGFDQYNQRLVKYYETQHEKAQQLEQDLGRVARVVQSASPARYAQLASIVETHIVAPLLEALYHETLRSAQRGYSFFTRYSEAYEERGRLTVYGSLLNATRDYLKRLPPESGQAPWLRWLRYWDARLQGWLREYQKTEEILEKLLPETVDDNKLRLWSLGDLGVALQQQYKLREARQVCLETLDLAVETREDPYNLPVAYSRVASLHWTLDELDQAADMYRQAIQSAEQENNPRMEGHAPLNLSGVLYDRGEWKVAVNTALEALHFARTRRPQDTSLHQTVAARFMFLLVRREPRLLDTCFAESEALLAAMGDPLQGLYLRNQYVDLLRQSGRLAQAESHFADLQRRAADQAKTSFGTELLLTQSLLHEDGGRLDAAIEMCTQVIERSRNGRGSAWLEAAALSNRGVYRSESARWSEAEADLPKAIEMWTRMGHDKLAAFMRVSWAEALLWKQLLADAQATLEGAPETLSEADTHRAQGDVHRFHARWVEASEQYRQALDGHLAQDQPEGTWQDLKGLMRVSAGQGNWAQAAEHAAAARALCRQLALNDHHALSAPSPLKPEQLAEAQELLDQAQKSLMDAPPRYLAHYYLIQGQLYRHQGRMAAAREQYAQALAIYRSVDQFQNVAKTLLNLALVAAGQEQWDQAAQHLTQMHGIWQQLAQLDRDSISKDAQETDERNAEGLRLFTAPGTDRLERVRQARDLFGLASERVPDNYWYRLNFAYACAELEEWTEAAETIRTVVEQGLEWLHPTRLYELLADGLEDAGEQRLKEGQPRDALERFGQAIQLEDILSRPDKLAALHGRTGYACFQLRASADARSHFSAALRCYRENGALDPGAALGETIRPLLRDAATYWALASEWQAWADQSDEGLQRDLAAATKALTGYLDELYQLTAQSSKSAAMMPVVTPIAVEIDQALIPEGPDTEWELFKTYLPEMRARFQETMGVRVPGVRIRGNDTDMPHASYIIMLDEVPLVLGYVQTDMGYCPASAAALEQLGIPAQSLKEAPHPLTGEPGCWIPPDYWEIIADHENLELWDDPIVYMVYHLEAVLHRNLADYLGLQEVENLLEIWKQDERGASLIQAALPDEAARLRFARVLRALVRERVPITRWQEILETIQEVRLDHDDVGEAVRAVRLRLKESLPGNLTPAKWTDLPAHIEDKLNQWLWRQDGKTFFALTPEETQEALSEVRELVGSNVRDVVLVTQSGELRPFVRRLVEIEFPDLMVLARDELLTPEEEMSSAPSEDASLLEGSESDV